MSAARASPRRALLARRAERVAPATDTKILAAWNGLAASALAEAGAILERTDWIDAAERAMDFVFDALVIDGRLMRSYREGVVKHLGYSEDYAAVLEASVALFEATFEFRWLERARWIADEAIRLFHDRDAGGFYSTGSDATPLVRRPKDLQDNAVPSANSVMALELQKLSLLTGRQEYESIAIGTMRLTRELMERAPLAFGHVLGALDFYTGDPVEVVVVGDQKGADTQALLACVSERWRPNKVLVVTDAPEKHSGSVPLLQGRTKIEGRATAYVCRHGRCELPVVEVDALRAQLAGR